MNASKQTSNEKIIEKDLTTSTAIVIYKRDATNYIAKN
jgi:hypothetical protein